MSAQKTEAAKPAPKVGPMLSALIGKTFISFSEFVDLYYATELAALL